MGATQSMTLSQKLELAKITWATRITRARQARANYVYANHFFEGLEQAVDLFDIYVIGDNVATIKGCTPVLAGHWIHLGGTQIKAWTVLEIEVQERPRPSSVLPSRMTVHIN